MKTKLRNILKSPSLSGRAGVGLYLPLLALLPTMAFADGELAKFNMSLTDGCITESVSGATYKVETGSLPAFNVAGARDEALRFDGYSNYIAAKLPDKTLSQMTLSLWCAAETYPMMNTAEAENTVTYTTLAGNLDEAAKKGLSIMLSSQGDLKMRFFTGGWGPYEILASKKLPRTQWNHLALTLDANKKLTLYMNGEQIGQSNTMGSIDLGSADFMIGKSKEEKKAGPFHINTFCGLIDDIILSDEATVDGGSAAVSPEHAPDFNYPASRYEANDLAALWRPSFHGMPSGAWTNETHGMVFSGGRYHLFFQKNANGPYMARLHWGHISSENLYDWREENIAFGPSESYDIKGCWSGCVYQAPVAGGSAAGQVTAYYTAVDNGKATICSATADDEDLLTWTKTTANPLVNGRPNGLSDDFRDCFVFETNGNQYMIVGTSKNNVGACTLHKLNGGSWTNDGSIFFQGGSKATAGRFFEMPNVTKMGDKWLFTATPLETSVGVETLYWLGDINADGTFNPSTPLHQPGKTDLDGFSKDGYGMLSPTIVQREGKTIALGIVPDKLATQYNEQIGWAHNYSLPREWTIVGDELYQKPFEGLKAMRTGETYALNNKTINGTEQIGTVRGRAVEIEAEFTVPDGSATGQDAAGQATEFGIALLDNARLSYTPATGNLKLDLTALQRIPNDEHSFNGVYQSVLPVAPKAGETLKLQVFLDHSILDIFVNDRYAASVRVFPTDPTADGLSLFSNGNVTLKSLSAWNLDAKQEVGIASISCNPSSRAAIYDLQGRKVENPARGLYIQNGKKVLIAR